MVLKEISVKLSRFELNNAQQFSALTPEKFYLIYILII